MSMFKNVVEFHEAFNLPVNTKTKFPDKQQRELRVKLLAEEVEEYIFGEEINDIENVAKELADIIYIVCGTAAVYGIPLDDVFKEVHRSNMSKLDSNGNPIFREDGKVLKSENYTPANLKDILNVSK